MRLTGAEVMKGMMLSKARPGQKVKKGREKDNSQITGNKLGQIRPGE